MRINVKLLLKDIMLKPSLFNFISFKTFMKFRKQSYVNKNKNLYDCVFPKFSKTFESLLKQSYEEIMKLNPENHEVFTNNPTVFVFWYQGEEHMPDVCKKCLESLKKFNDDKQIIIVDKNNFKNYVDIDKHIIELLEKGRISITHFSDILRFNLLSKYQNSIWCDATLLFIDKIPTSYFYMNYITISEQSNANEKEQLIYPNFPWGYVYFVGGNDKTMFRFISIFWSNYFKKFSQVYDYFTTSMAIYWFFLHDSNFAENVKVLPKNNSECESLLPIANDKLSLLKIERITADNTFMFKMNWHRKFIKIDENGEQTNFGYLIKKYEIE